LATKILTATVIGLHRAERLIYSCFERGNHRKRIRRCGDQDDGTHATEKLALINTFATTLGYDPLNVPYPNLSIPSVNNTFKECIGFTYKTEGEDVSNPTSNQYARCNGEEMQEPAINDEDLAALLAGTNFDDLNEEDVEVDFGDIEDVSVEPETIRQLNFAETADKSWMTDLTHKDLIEQTVQRLLPPSIGRETTLQSFRRLTLEAPWIPFRTINSEKPPTELDLAEYRLFEDFLSTGRHSPHVSPGAARGFNQLEREWNLEAAKRFRAWSSGEQDVELINRKSTKQLMDHWKKKDEWERIFPLVDRDNPNRIRLGNVLRDN